MDASAIQQYVDYINTQFPWATEDTVKRLAELSRDNNIRTVALAAGIQKALGAADAKRLETYIKDAVRDVRSSQASTKNATKNLKKHTSDLTSGLFTEQQGLESMTTLANATAESLDKLAEAGGDFLSSFGRIGDLAGQFINSVTGTATAFTSVAVIASRLIVEQEKQVRSIMDLGVVLGDVANYTTIRGQLASLGMTISQYNELLGGVQHLLTQPGSLIEGSGQFLTFLSAASTRESIRHFGYAPAAAARALAEEAQHLFELNEINSLNENGQRRIIDSFQTVNEMAIYMAENFGVQRSALLEQRRAARQNTDFMLGMAQNSELMNERYGEGASQRIQEAYDWLSMLAPLLGEEFGSQTLNILGGVVGDLHLDESVVNNMLDDGFRQRLQLLGPEVFSMYTNLLRDAATGAIPDRANMMSRFNQLAIAIRQSDPRLGLSPEILGANELIAAATLIPEDILLKTDEQIRRGVNGVQSAVDLADDPINMVGDLSTAFLEVQHQITPGFQTMGTVISALEVSVGRFADFWLELFGGDITPDPNRQRLTISQAQQALNRELLSTMTGGSVGGSFSALGSSNAPQVESTQATITRLEGEYNAAQEELARVQSTIAAGRNTEEEQRLLAELRQQIESLEERKTAAERARDESADAVSAQAVRILETRERYNTVIGDAQEQLDAANSALETARTNGENEGAIRQLEQTRQEAQQLLEQRRAAAAPIQQEIDAMITHQQSLAQAAQESADVLADINTELSAAESSLGRAEHDTHLYRMTMLRDAQGQITERMEEIETALGAARTQLEEERARTAQLVGGEGMAGLLSFISRGEGGYESSNRGTRGNQIIGSTHSTVRNGRALTDLTIAEIMQYQSIDSASNPNRLFAVGRYQIIPPTLREAVASSGIDVNRRFDQATQDELGVWLVTDKRPAVGAYLRGESDNITLAMEQLALEFASIPVPHDMRVDGRLRRRGQSAYGSGNRASHSVEEVQAMLERARAQHAAQVAEQQQAAVSTTASGQTTVEPVAQPNTNRNARIAELQSEQERRINEINAITSDPSRLNTTTGDINTQGLNEADITRLTTLENELQATLREIARLQAQQRVN